jgi:demethylmenaquinone methyltransferase/2-methoxy-6-polyprenyl-1,4-benzoquinol methylase
MTNESKNPETIQSMFGKIAKHYDFTNGILSFQLHKLWNRKLTHSIQAKETLLDICSGTGEIAYRWLEDQKTPKTAIFLDFCEQMLEGAKAKRLPHMIKGHQLRFIQADATALPIANESVDAVSVAYGIRNVQSPSTCFNEVFRVLRPKGTFSILELTEPRNRFLRYFHKIYLNKFLPFAGGLLTKEKDAYAYLAKSVQTFTKPEELKIQLLNSGFQTVNIRSLTGGIATLIEAHK